MVRVLQALGFGAVQGLGFWGFACLGSLRVGDLQV
jgi:hypothetical protein